MYAPIGDMLALVPSVSSMATGALPIIVVSCVGARAMRITVDARVAAPVPDDLALRSAVTAVATGALPGIVVGRVRAGAVVVAVDTYIKI